MTIKNLGLIMIGAVLFASITSCKKARLNKNDTTSSEDNATSENMFADVFQQVEEVGASENSVNKDFNFSSHCATITVQTTAPDTFPKTVTIDFGTAGCTGHDGRTRKGKIIAVFSGRYRKAGTVVDVTPQDYYVNDNKVEGSKKFTNNGKDANGNWNFTVVVDGKVTNSAGEVITWKSNRTNTLIEGANTPYVFSDNVHSITGTGSGVDRKGRAFTVNITEPLIKQIGCRWIKQGKITITPDQFDERVIDFGAGNCDDDATVTVNGNTRNIKLR